MTLNELLLTPYYRGNKSLLAKELNINRGTLRKYLPDTGGYFHFVRANGALGPAELFTNQSNKGDK
jgi:hypothetical protein